MLLKPTGTGSDDGKIHLMMEDEGGKEHSMVLSVFDVSTLVSMLYAARAQALNGPPDATPEVALPIVALAFGESEEHELLRISVAEGVHQDFAVVKGSPLAILIQTMAEAWARVNQTEDEDDAPKLN